jgi:hypothetical protein
MEICCAMRKKKNGPRSTHRVPEARFSHRRIQRAQSDLLIRIASQSLRGPKTRITSINHHAIIDNKGAFIFSHHSCFQFYTTSARRPHGGFRKLSKCQCNMQPKHMSSSEGFNPRFMQATERHTSVVAQLSIDRATRGDSAPV